MGGVTKPTAWALVALLAAASVAEAQMPGAPGGGPQVRVQALGAVAMSRARPHYAGGGLVQLGVGPASVIGLGMAGTGGRYESLLGGGAIGLRLLRIGPVDLTGFGGYGIYREEGWSGIRRDAGGVLMGGLAAVDFGAVAITLGALQLMGRYDENDVPEPFRFRVPRLTVGFGI
ncbi:MAG: hypothetical protein FWJ74_05595 [Gemmatimonadota bacterium]|jgi:hypothetical protein